MTNRYIPIFLIILTYSLSAMGQKMSSGYILTNQDTIRGFIRSEKSGQIEFKSSDDDFREYQSSDLVGFGIVEDHYRSKIVNGQSQFLKILISGKGSLYVLENDFYIENDNQLVQLERNSFKYIGTVNAVLNDCNRLRSTTSSLEYGEIHFVNLLIDYNECVGANYSLSKRFSESAETGFVENEKHNYFSMVSGYNDQILGVGVESIFSKYFAGRLRAGFGGLRAKFSGGIKIGNQHKSGFNIGITPNLYLGLDETHADFSQDRTAILQLKRIITAQFTCIYNWRFGKGNALFFETGYALALGDEFYTVTRPPLIGSSELSESEKNQLKSLQQTGLIASIGFNIKL